jgi:hypothetical protein
MNDQRPKRDTMSLEEATISNMWEVAPLVEVLDRKGLLLKGKGQVVMDTLSRFLLWIGVSVLLGGTAGCHYYEEFRVKKTTADLQEERAALLHDYRLCLEKYQEEPPKAKEFCAPYTQRLREIEITH